MTVTETSGPEPEETFTQNALQQTERHIYPGIFDFYQRINLHQRNFMMIIKRLKLIFILFEHFFLLCDDFSLVLVKKKSFYIKQFGSNHRVRNVLPPADIKLLTKMTFHKNLFKNTKNPLNVLQ